MRYEISFSTLNTPFSSLTSDKGANIIKKKGMTRLVIFNAYICPTYVCLHPMSKMALFSQYIPQTQLCFIIIFDRELVCLVDQAGVGQVLTKIVQACLLKVIG